MKRRRRLRRVLKWCGLAACFLILEAFVVSLSRSVWWTTATNLRIEHRGFYFGLRRGALWLQYHHWKPVFPAGRRVGGPYPGGWGTTRPFTGDWIGWSPDVEWIWWFQFSSKRRPTGLTTEIVIPMWFLLALAFILTAYLWYRDRRRWPPGHCQKCGYDLTGNESGRCPECGTEVSAEEPKGLEA